MLCNIRLDFSEFKGMSCLSIDGADMPEKKEIVWLRDHLFAIYLAAPLRKDINGSAGLSYLIMRLEREKV